MVEVNNGDSLSPWKIRAIGLVTVTLIMAVIVAAVIDSLQGYKPHAEIDTFGTYEDNHYGVGFTLRDVPPNSNDLWLMQFTGEHFVVYDTLPYRAIPDESSYIPGSYINVQGDSTLTFVLTDPALSNQIMGHNDVGAADGFKNLDPEELRGAYIIYTNQVLPNSVS